MSQVETVKIKDGDDFSIINADDFNPSVHKLCDGETLSESHQITVTLNTEIAPELQQVIDEAKAECEKVVAEKAELQEQLNKEREAVKKLTSENTELQGKVSIAEKTLVAADKEINALKAASKKPTTAEVKAAKAAEEAKTTESPKE